MITKEKVKDKIDQLSETDFKRIFLFLTSIGKEKNDKVKIPPLKLGGKLDKENIRSIAYK